MAAITYRLIENPVRHTRVLARHTGLTLAIGAILIIVTLGIAQWQIATHYGAMACPRMRRTMTRRVCAAWSAGAATGQRGSASSRWRRRGPVGGGSAGGRGCMLGRGARAAPPGGGSVSIDVGVDPRSVLHLPSGVYAFFVPFRISTSTRTAPLVGRTTPRWAGGAARWRCARSSSLTSRPRRCRLSLR